MGFLKNLFSGKLGATAAELEAAVAQKRTAPRIHLLPLHRIGFAVRGLAKNPLGVSNVSLSGIGFTKDSLGTWPEPGSELEGELVTEAKKAEARVRLVHLAGQVAGCQFLGDLLPIQRLVLDYFRIELAALHMIQAPADVLQEEPDGLPNWYHGKNNCELFYVTKPGEPGNLLRFHLSFFANYIEGGAGTHPRFGTVIEDDFSIKPKHKGSALVKWEEIPAPEHIETVVKFLGNVPGLPATLRDELARQIRWVREKK